MAVFADEDQVRAVDPNFSFIVGMDSEGLLNTAPGGDCDYVSCYFAPHVGINEDPVTGSAHCVSAPYWAKRFGKDALHARQVSAHGGELFCRFRDDSVEIAGKVILFMEGEISL
jgi:predicted PhzF superfamily epimerase YddE/YHI9